MIGTGTQPPAGGDIDDSSCTTFSEKGNSRAADPKRCLDIDGKRLPVILICGICEGAAANDAGIVDNDIQAAKDSFSLCRKSIAVGRISEIAGQGSGTFDAIKLNICCSDGSAGIR